MNTTFRNRLFVAWLTLQLALLGGWAGMHEWQREYAPRVLLKLRPVDPNDILRGRYQAIGFDAEQISNDILQKSGFDLTKLPTRGDRIWVTLTRGVNAWHEVASVARQRPTTSLPILCVRYDSEWQDWNSEMKHSRKLGICVSFGMNRYFIPARADNLPQGSNHVILGEVSITPSGNGQLERLQVDGKSY